MLGKTAGSFLNVIVPLAKNILAPLATMTSGSQRAGASLRSDVTSQITPFLRECFFTPLWRIINSGRVKTGKKTECLGNNKVKKEIRI